MNQYTAVHFCFLTIGTFSQNAMMKRVRGFAPYLLEAGHQVTIVAEDTAENRDYFSEVRAEKVFFSGSGVFREVQQKIRILQRLSPDLVYACGWGLRNGAALMGDTSIIEHAEMLSSFPSEERRSILRAKDYLMEWISIIGADGLVLASNYLLRCYKARDIFESSNKVKIPYGVKGGIYSGKNDSLDNENVTKVLYMGTLYESYGILDIVDSIPHVVDAGVPAEFIILGDGPDRKAAIDRARALDIKDHIHFEGYVGEDVLEQRLASADVFVAPMFDTVKDKARCPSKIPMYMRHQKPIVSCRVGEVPAYLEDSGYYYEAGNPISMARQIVRAAQKEGSIRYNVEKFTWSQLSNKFLKWLEESIKVR